MNTENTEFEIKIETGDMFDFMMYHNNSSISGKISIVFSVAMLILAAATHESFTINQTIILVVLGLLFTVVNPAMLFVKSLKQVKLNPMFKKPLTYKLEDKKIIISQDGKQNEIPLNEVTRVVETRKSIIIYVTRVRAFIWPKKLLNELCPQVKDILRKSLEPGILKIK